MQFPMIPIQYRVFPKPQIKLPKERDTYNNRYFSAYAGEIRNTMGKPFFNILTDNGIASLFLEAVAANTEEAWAFVSKNFVNAIDLDALRDVLGQKGNIRTLVKASFSRDPKNCLTSSVLVVNPDRNEKSILHLHMIKEPDRFGQWKIYGVEKE